MKWGGGCGDVYRRRWGLGVENERRNGGVSEKWERKSQSGPLREDN